MNHWWKLRTLIIFLAFYIKKSTEASQDGYGILDSFELSYMNADRPDMDQLEDKSWKGLPHYLSYSMAEDEPKIEEHQGSAADYLPSFLQSNHIHMADPDRVQKIMQNIIQDGPNKLQIISDWDHTLTLPHIEGGPTDRTFVTWDVMEFCRLLPTDFKQQIIRINEKHKEAELNHSMTHEDKIKLTIKWYSDTYDEILKYKPLQKETLHGIAEHFGFKLRKKSELLFKKLDNLAIPTMVVSAGWGDLILELLKFNNINMKFIKVISNFLLYDEHGAIIGITDPIYPFTKKEAALNYYQTYIDRSNAILIGSTVEDAIMDAGIHKNNNILKIGFLNGPEKNPENLNTFKNFYDIVVEDDDTMDIMIAIIDALKS